MQKEMAKAMRKNKLNKIYRSNKQKYAKDGREKDYKKITETGKNMGIADLIEVYNRYKRLANTSEEYLGEIDAKFVFSTSDSSI